jgi:hypothetical protein
MKKSQLHLKNLLTLLAAASLFCLVQPVRAQSAPAQDNRDDKTVQDNDITRNELARFDQFLDSHREIAEQLRKDPSLINNKEFVEKHPALQTFLQQQPGVREELKENPNAFMRQENRFDHEEATNRDTRQADRFDRRDDARDRDTHERFAGFLVQHDPIAKDLSRDPSLAKNHDYIEHHPELQAYLNENADVRNDLIKDPQNFVKSAQQVNHNNTGWTAPQTQKLDPQAPVTKPKQ